MIDELCEKIHEIEKQNTIENDDLIGEKSLSTSPSSSSSGHEKEEKRNKKYYRNRSSSSPIDDPAKRYYRAFPSLSKEPEENMDITNTAIMQPLTWPNSNSLNTSGKIINNNNMNSNNNSTSGGSSILNINSANNTAGVKKRTKRRRNNSNHVSIKNQLLHHRKAHSMSEEDSSEKSNSLWDTNFEGAWEMGHDLIRDFILKQNKRNRSISENEVQNYSDDKYISQSNFEKYDIAKNNNDEDPLIQSSDINADDKDDILNASAKDDIDGYATPDTFTSFCELADIAASKHNNPIEPRRLYERDVSNETVDAEENENYAIFEAKFNRSVEALWNDNNEKDLSLDANSNNNQNDLNMFWSNYQKHKYRPRPLGGIANNDPLTEYRNNVGVDYLSQLLDGPSPQQSSGIKKNDFIEAGTNLQSSIWSNNSDNLQSDNGIYSRELWDKHDPKNINNVSTIFIYL